MLRNVIAALVLLALNIGLAPAGEIRVLAAVAVKDPLDRFAQGRRAPPATVDIGYSLTGPILADIKAGKPSRGHRVAGTSCKMALVGAGLLPIAVERSRPPPVSAIANITMPSSRMYSKPPWLLRAAPSISYTDQEGDAELDRHRRALVEEAREQADEVMHRAPMVSRKIADPANTWPGSRPVLVMYPVTPAKPLLNFTQPCMNML